MCIEPHRSKFDAPFPSCSDQICPLFITHRAACNLHPSQIPNGKSSVFGISNNSVYIEQHPRHNPSYRTMHTSLAYSIYIASPWSFPCAAVAELTRTNISHAKCSMLKSVKSLKENGKTPETVSLAQIHSLYVVASVISRVREHHANKQRIYREAILKDRRNDHRVSRVRSYDRRWGGDQNGANIKDGCGPPVLRCSNSKERPGQARVAELPASPPTCTTSSAGCMSAAASWRARSRREDSGLAFQCWDWQSEWHYGSGRAMAGVASYCCCLIETQWLGCNCFR